MLVLFDFIWFYNISTMVCYLMPNPLYTYIVNIYDLWTHFVSKVFSNEPKLIFLHTVKSFQVLLCIANDSSKHQSFICCILTFDPAKLAIPRRCTGSKWHILMAVMRGNRVGGNWLTKWDKLKFPWYTHRLMSRKRVTCELHDSYFRLMTIKHAIPKIE